MADNDTNTPDDAGIASGPESGKQKSVPEDVLIRLVEAINTLTRQESQQTESLERLEDRIEDSQREQEQNRWTVARWMTRFIIDREAGWRAWLVKMSLRLVALVLGISGFWGFMGWYIDRLEIVRMASTYSDTAVQVYQEEENTNVALELLDRAVDLNGNDSDVRFQRAFIGGMAVVRDLLNLDRPINKEEIDKAHEALAQAHILQRLRPQSAEPHILSSQIYVSLGKFEDAEREINSALALAKDDPLVRWRHATFLMEKVKNGADEDRANKASLLDEAEKELDAALHLCQNTSTEESMNTSLFSVLTRPFVAEGESRRNARLDKMILLWKGVLEAEHRKNYEKARQYYDFALKIDPEFSLARSSRGLAWLQDSNKDFAKAAEDFKQALNTDPNCVEAYYGLGMTYGYQDRYETARYYFDKGLSINSSSLRLWKWRGVVNAELQLWDDALQDYQKALELNPADPDLYIRKAKVLQKTGKPEEAIRDLLFASELSPDNPEISYTLGNIYLSVGDAERALDRYAVALKSKPDFDDCWAAQAEAFEKAGRAEEALNSLNQAVACTRQKPERFLLRRGNLKQQLGESRGALEDFQAARNQDAELAEAWLGEARVLMAVNKRDEALAALERFINLRPEDAEGRRLQESLTKSE